MRSRRRRGCVAPAEQTITPAFNLHRASNAISLDLPLAIRNDDSGGRAFQRRQQEGGIHTQLPANLVG